MVLKITVVRCLDELDTSWAANVDGCLELFLALSPLLFSKFPALSSPLSIGQRQKKAQCPRAALSLPLAMLRVVLAAVLTLSVLHLGLGAVSVCVGMISSIQAVVWMAHRVSPIWSGGFVSCGGGGSRIVLHNDRCVLFDPKQMEMSSHAVLQYFLLNFLFYRMTSVKSQSVQRKDKLLGIIKIRGQGRPTGHSTARAERNLFCGCTPCLNPDCSGVVLGQRLDGFCKHYSFKRLETGTE